MIECISSRACALLLGLAAFQEPPKPSQDPPRPQEPVRDPKPGATIDPELRAALDAFQHVKSYRFRVEGQIASPWNPASTTARDKSVAKAAQPAAGEAPGFTLDCICESELPLQVAGESMEAFRSNDRIAYRTTKDGEWQVMANLQTRFGAGADAGSSAKGAKPEAEKTAKALDAGPPNGGVRLLPMIARLRLPHVALERLDAQVASCTRVAEDKAAGTITFECLFRSETGPRGEQAPIAAAPTRLRIVVKHGIIDELMLDTRPPFAADAKADGKSAPAAPAENASGVATGSARATLDVADSILRYKLSDFDVARVEVPEEVVRLLER